MASMTKEVSENIVSEFGTKAQDTGSIEVQVALATHRIKWLTNHVRTHKKDFHSRLGLTKLVAKRRRLLKYLKNRNLEQYRNIISKLGIRG